MVSTTFQQAPAIDIQLPESASAENTARGESVEIWIDEKGIITIEGNILSEDELTKVVQEKFQKDKTLSVTVNADGRVAHKRAVQIIDLVQKVGIENIAIGTDANP